MCVKIKQLFNSFFILMHRNSNHHITHLESHGFISGSKINWLRAAVLGANDGIVSVAAVVVGVAGATQDTKAILTAGVAALSAGALSMAVGEYVSVSTQRDTEKALLQKERHELATSPDAELEELVTIYQRKGLSRSTAELVGKELTKHDALGEHAEVELGIDPHNLTNPWYAAYASGLAFLCGAVIPIGAIIVAPANYDIMATFASVIVALIITGALSANAGGSRKRVAIIRVVFGGVIAMAVTFGIGKLFGVTGI
jgi:VIT1/CCC1 family predicted Fe2+/Mn2+ transporter